MSDDPNDINKLSAQNTDSIEEAPDPDGPANPSATVSEGDSNGGASVPKTYQDDLDASDEVIDPVANESTENPADLLQVPSDKFKEELDGLALDEGDPGTEDMRETIEDRDEADDNAASASQ